jgi:DNA-binding protein YbaB
MKSMDVMESLAATEVSGCYGNHTVAIGVIGNLGMSMVALENK